MTDNALAGIRVLVTRPRSQGNRLDDAIAAKGGTPVRFPVMQVDARDPARIADDAERLFDPDIAIFVSGNAVRFGGSYAGSARIAAIGPATARQLEKLGHSVDIKSADGFDSEHLLDTPALKQVEGKVVRIIRGNGGREVLASTLRDRGATVEYLEVYARRVPDYTPDDIAGIGSALTDGQIECITVMSVISFLNLLALLPSTCHDALRKTPLVTPAARVIIEAEKRFPGIQTTLAQGPQADDMVAAIVTSTNPGTSDD